MCKHHMRQTGNLDPPKGEDTTVPALYITAPAKDAPYITAPAKDAPSTRILPWAEPSGSKLETNYLLAIEHLHTFVLKQVGEIANVNLQNVATPFTQL